MWDSEEDHLLSYFLGDHQAAQAQASGHFNGSTGLRESNSNVAPKQGGRSSRTPAVHFYASSKESGVPRAAPLGSASSSSSSLSSMAATLVSGGPVLHHYHAVAPRPCSAISPNMSISPISPAVAMGTPQEMLMLPPPPRNPTESSEIERRQQHIAWLNQVNAMAIMNQQQQAVVLPQHYGAALAPGPVFPPPVAELRPQQESEERRAKRLARNRESARQSRRRKKENLARLSAKVNGLQGEIEVERRLKLNEMEQNLQKLRRGAIQQLPDDDAEREAVRELLDEFGPNGTIRQNCTSFQYSALRQLMLPKYQVFILWLTLQRESFFTAGKEERAKTDSSRAIGRVSSKQIGEEITSTWKKSQPKEGKNSPTEEEMMDAEDRALKTGTDEAERMWPLFCFEMSISVDQEEKLLNFHKGAQESPTLATDRTEMSDATKMVTNMKQGILNHGQSTVGRSENMFLTTLSPTQSANYFKWYAENGDRRKQTTPAPCVKQEASDNKENNSIGDLCKRLHEVLLIPDTDILVEPGF